MSDIFLSPAFCAHNEVILCGKEDASVVIGMIDYGNKVLKKRIENTFPGTKFIFRAMSKEDYNLALSTLLSVETPEAIHSESSNSTFPFSEDIKIDNFTTDSPIANLLNGLFLEAVSKRASDIHVEIEREHTRLRFRIDGILYSIGELSKDRGAALTSRVKLLANLNILENRRPQDGRIDIRTDEYTLDVRVSVTPTAQGESLVMRLLNKSNTLLDLDRLGFTQGDLLRIKEKLGCKSGLILVTGPTGSGKTTSLSSMLKYINDETIKIVSIEDPVEYRLPGVTQIQTHEEIGITFNTILKRIFRQDPDVIMVGEIRDSETASLAIRASMTGHLVFATLHTNGALEAITRLQNLGIKKYLLSSVLRMIIAQRLVRKNCNICKGEGCSCCSKTGFYGRTVISEIATIDKETRSLIDAYDDLDSLEKKFILKGFQTFGKDAQDKIIQGLTTHEEVMRETGLSV